MKVGILTFHNGINYGGFFQTYSLQSYLKQEGYDCSVINYKNFGFTKREYQYFLNLKNPVSALRNLQKINQFKKAHKNLALTPRIFNQKDLAKFDFNRVIIGSDEVWNFDSDFIGYDPTYFAEGINAEKIISYAASFGSVKPDSRIPGEIADFLKRFSSISVRDVNSAEVLAELGKDTTDLVLDPTFLFDVRAQAKIPSESDFILVYGFFTEEMIKQIKSYAKVRNKKIISVGYYHSWADKSFSTLNPFEWLGYFLTCNCVITTMYHGMIYSILAQKQFCMFESDSRLHKVGNMLKSLNLSNHFIPETESLSGAIGERIDYREVDNLLNQKRVASKRYLINALGKA